MRMTSLAQPLSGQDLSNALQLVHSGLQGLMIFESRYPSYVCGAEAMPCVRICTVQQLLSHVSNC